MSFDFNASGEAIHPLLNLGLATATATYDPQRQRYTITTATGASILPQDASTEFSVIPPTNLISHPQSQQHLHNSLPQTQPQPQPLSTSHQNSQVQLGLHSPIHIMTPQATWAMGLDMTSVSPTNSPQSQSTLDEQQLHQHQQQQGHRQQFHQSQPNSQCSSPHSQNSSQHSPLAFPASLNPLPDWALQQQQQQQQQQSSPVGHQHHSPPLQPLQHTQIPVAMTPVDAQAINDQALLGFSAFPSTFNQTPLGLLPPVTQNALGNTMAMEAYNMPAMDDPIHWPNLGYESWSEIATSPLEMSPLPRGMHSVGSGSPNSAYIDVVSLPGSVSGMSESWNMVDWRNAGMIAGHPNAAIFNPGQTLHLRNHSDSDSMAQGFTGFEELSFPFSPSGSENHDASSPISQRNCYHDESQHMPHSHGHGHSHSHSHGHSHSQEIRPDAVATPIAIKSSHSTRSSPSSKSPGNGSGVITSSPASTGTRRSSGPRKSPISKPKVVRRTSTGKKDGPTEKKVGRRKGPLLPEQRKQASEIRKLRACLRCKFLKKTCDKGEPCAGCQPSHARLWQVPCTRIDIKDIGYFMKDWNADYIREGIPTLDAKCYSKTETLIWITHGYGFALPVMAREVLVEDEKCFEVDWVDTSSSSGPEVHSVQTDRLDIGSGGVSPQVISDYLDKHVDERFTEFVDDYFDGTPFITEILKTAHSYYKKEKSPVIRKALKLVMAYNLTMHITMIENPSPEVPLEADATIESEGNKFYGRTVAPSLINIQIKNAMAEMWRELQRDVLEELSQLYSSVYSGERLKNWPTIFMLASILLAVWEEMQFDCHYRVVDPASVSKFCSDMETTPVGVIVGLFHAISQKLPAFTDWDTRKHGHILNNNPAVCEALTEVRQHVTKHESYLRGRPEAKFDGNDFDSLSNKFLSKLVIKAN